MRKPFLEIAFLSTGLFLPFPILSQQSLSYAQQVQKVFEQSNAAAKTQFNNAYPKPAAPVVNAPPAGTEIDSNITNPNPLSSPAEPAKNSKSYQLRPRPEVNNNTVLNSNNPGASLSSDSSGNLPAESGAAGNTIFLQPNKSNSGTANSNPNQNQTVINPYR